MSPFFAVCPVLSLRIGCKRVTNSGRCLWHNQAAITPKCPNSPPTHTRAVAFLEVIVGTFTVTMMTMFRFQFDTSRGHRTDRYKFNTALNTT